MYNRHEQIEIIQSIKVVEGESKTIDCPFCHGKKKFSITNKDGTILWNCYKASCSIKGAYRKGMTLSLIRNRMGIPKETLGQYLQRSMDEQGLTLRKIPSMVSPPKNHAFVMNYLEENGCLPAYEQGLAKILYAPAENRCLFMMNDGRGAVGRSLNGATPKWMSYGITSGALTVGTSDVGIIVEDAPSACAVGVIDGYAGIAILGTNLSTKQKQSLKNYKKIIICLDNDAKKKAIILLRQLQGLVNCTIRFINKDLKYCRSDEIANVIESPGL